MYLPLEVIETHSNKESLMGQFLWNNYNYQEVEDMAYVKKVDYKGSTIHITSYEHEESSESYISQCQKNFFEFYHNVFKTDKERKDMFDNFLDRFICLKSWESCKQVYKFQQEFFSILIETEVLEVSSNDWTRNVLQRLPYDTFYIDTEECILPLTLKDEDNLTKTHNVNGVFVHVDKKKDYSNIFMYFCIDKSQGVSSNFILYKNTIYDVGESIDSCGIVMQLHTKMLNCLLYLCANNRELDESPITKKTYRPTNHIRNRFSEIRQWDVGVRVGNTIGIQNKKESEEQKERRAVTTRHSPRPHMRKGHWKLYHVGEGRKETKMNWLLPTYVGGNKPLPTVIHRVS